MTTNKKTRGFEDVQGLGIFSPHSIYFRSLLLMKFIYYIRLLFFIILSHLFNSKNGNRVFKSWSSSSGSRVRRGVGNGTCADIKDRVNFPTPPVYWILRVYWSRRLCYLASRDMNFIVNLNMCRGIDSGKWIIQQSTIRSWSWYLFVDIHLRRM